MARPKTKISFVQRHEMEPFLFDIKGLMKELHVAIYMYEIELISQGYSAEEASSKASQECMRIRQEIAREDAEGIL
jgi:hypothetical protein